MMNRAASHSHQAGEGSAFSQGGHDETGITQPVDPFEDIPRGVSHEEVGFGSLAFEDSVIVERSGRERFSAASRVRIMPVGTVSRLRLANR